MNILGRIEAVPLKYHYTLSDHYSFLLVQFYCFVDDQCRAPGTTDKTFANDLYQKLTGKPRFEANFRQVGARQFGVFHYAGEYECILYRIHILIFSTNTVEFNVNFFGTKHQDWSSMIQMALLRKTKMNFLVRLQIFCSRLQIVLSKSLHQS